MCSTDVSFMCQFGMSYCQYSAKHFSPSKRQNLVEALKVPAFRNNTPFYHLKIVLLIMMACILGCCNHNMNQLFANLSHFAGYSSKRTVACTCVLARWIFLAKACPQGDFLRHLSRKQASSAFASLLHGVLICITGQWIAQRKIANFLQSWWKIRDLQTSREQTSWNSLQ